MLDCDWSSDVCSSDLKKILIALAATSMLAPAAISIAASKPAAKAADKPQYGTFGFDEAGMDRSVAPGDDFYAYASGNWTRTTPIPSDRSNFGMFTVLEELSTQRSHDILEEVAKTPGSRVGDFYASFMDEKAADALGAKPLAPTIAEIKALADKSAVAAEFSKLRKQGVNAPIILYVGQDDKEPENYIVNAYQGGLGMPDRDYYLNRRRHRQDARRV
jgi:putative endopeptidase